MDQSAQERAGCQHGGAACDFAAIGEADAPHRPVHDQQIVDFGLQHGEIRRLANRALHRLRVKLAVGLRARTAHRRTLAAVQDPELDAALVGRAAHQAVQRVDFADQMALPEPADRRIAGHRPDGGEPMRHERRPGAHPRSRGRGFAAGVAAADHDDIEGNFAHGRSFYSSGVSQQAPAERPDRHGGESECFT